MANKQGLSVNSPQITNPMTTLGDEIVGNVGGDPARIGVGANGTTEIVDPTAPFNASYQPLMYYKNRLVNSGFEYWQVRNTLWTQAGGVSPFYAADQWKQNANFGADGNIQTVRQAGQVDGSLYQYKFVVNPAAPTTGLGTPYGIVQPLSNLASKALYNKTISASAQIKALGNVNQVTIDLMYNTSESTVSNTVIQSTQTTINSGSFTLCLNNNAAVGTAMTTSGIVLIQIRVTGVSSGNLADLGNGLIVEQAMLNLGPVAMPWCRQNEDPNLELKACQFFFEKSTDPDVVTQPVPAVYTGTDAMVGYGNDPGGDWSDYGVKFKAVKRIIPTITLGDGSSNTGCTQYNGANALTTAVSASASNQGISGFVFATVLTQFKHGAFFQWTADARI